MNQKMFCFQCEQTAGCTGCTGNAGVCGKKADTSKSQDELTGALIGLARAIDGTAAISKETAQVIIEGLFTTVTNAVSYTHLDVYKRQALCKPSFPTPNSL